MTMAFDFTRDRQERIPDAMLLDVGAYIAENYLLRALDFPVGYDVSGAAIHWLEEIGFDRAEVIMDPARHDICLMLLWRGKQEAVIEFAGSDDMVVTLFNFAAERVVEPNAR